MIAAHLEVRDAIVSPRAIRKAVYRKSDEDGYVMVYGEMPPGGLVNWEDYCDLTESA